MGRGRTTNIYKDSTKYSGMLRRVDCQIFTNISEAKYLPTFRKNIMST